MRRFIQNKKKYKNNNRLTVARLLPWKKWKIKLKTRQTYKYKTRTYVVYTLVDHQNKKLQRLLCVAEFRSVIIWCLFLQFQFITIFFSFVDMFPYDRNKKKKILFVVGTRLLTVYVIYIVVLLLLWHSFKYYNWMVNIVVCARSYR